jgi:hypothetical protein
MCKHRRDNIRVVHPATPKGKSPAESLQPVPHRRPIFQNLEFVRQTLHCRYGCPERNRAAVNRQNRGAARARRQAPGYTTIAARSPAMRAQAAAASSSNNSVSFCIIVPPSSSASTIVTARR